MKNSKQTYQLFLHSSFPGQPTLLSMNMGERVKKNLFKREHGIAQYGIWFFKVSQYFMENYPYMFPLFINETIDPLTRVHL